jgi:DNA-binding NarL/FixJ family response regulator
VRGFKKINRPAPFSISNLRTPDMFIQTLFQDPLVEPTPRELEVLSLICDGHSTKEIAARLHLSFRTVSCHRSRLMQKAGGKNCIRLFRWALAKGYVSFPSKPPLVPERLLSRFKVIDGK